MPTPTFETQIHLPGTAAVRAGEEPPEWTMEPYPETTIVGPRIGERA
jgi:hypothetical protein